MMERGRKGYVKSSSMYYVSLYKNDSYYLKYVTLFAWKEIMTMT